MPSKINLIGQKFGKLTVIEETKERKNKSKNNNRWYRKGVGTIAYHLIVALDCLGWIISKCPRHKWYDRPIRV